MKRWFSGAMALCLSFSMALGTAATVYADENESLVLQDGIEEENMTEEFSSEMNSDSEDLTSDEVIAEDMTEEDQTAEEVNAEDDVSETESEESLSDDVALIEAETEETEKNDAALEIKNEAVFSEEESSITLCDESEGYIPADGIYRTTATTNHNMFKVVDVVLTSNKGVLSAVITLSGKGYDYLYMGDKEEAFAADESSWIPALPDDEGRYTYTIPVASVGTVIRLSSRSARYASEGKGVDAWIEREIVLSKENLEKIGDIPVEPALADGVYSGQAKTNAQMFKVTAVELTSKEGLMEAVITLSGKGYDYLFMGTKEEAYAADESEWIKAVIAEDGSYTYKIPVKALDEDLMVASRSARYASEGKGLDAWMDRTVNIISESLVKIRDIDPEKPTPVPTPTVTPTPTPTPTPAPTPAPVPQEESSHTSDSSGTTSQVDSSTQLADGVYTPDAFSFSGGTGKVQISCSQISVSGGKAYATIAFSSPKYTYVKANGNMYYPTVSGGSSIFTIPVELNKNNTIIGQTVAMSAAHEITYSIFVYLAAAEGKKGTTNGSLVSTTNDAIDEVAPTIAGLTYKSETKLEYSDYIKIFQYEDGITLVEIDMKKNSINEKKEDSKKDSVEKQILSDEGEVIAKTEEELTADLYLENVVKYLIVPEGKEIPAGLGKQMVVIQVKNEDFLSYAASSNAIDMMDSLKVTSNIKALGVKESDIDSEALLNAIKDKKVVNAGEGWEIDYKTIVKEKINLALMSGDLLSKTDEKGVEKDSETKEDDAEDYNTITGRFAMLGAPVIIDRSIDEKSELAKLEWIKVYGALFGQMDLAEQLFNTAVKAAQ